MKLIDDTDSFSLVDVSEFVIPIPSKVVDTRGYIYVLIDEVFSDFFKIGRTMDMQKRLQAYNADKPYKTTFVHAISAPFQDSIDVESKIIKALYKTTSPTTFSKEWFSIDHLDLALSFIEEAEQSFQLMENNHD